VNLTLARQFELSMLVSLPFVVIVLSDKFTSCCPRRITAGQPEDATLFCQVPEKQQVMSGGAGVRSTFLPSAAEEFRLSAGFSANAASFMP
jgi:hypothetical protein